jgi:hypothetical protein
VSARNDDLQSLFGFSRWVQWSLYLQIALAIAALVSGALEYQLLVNFRDGIYASTDRAIEDGESSDSRQQVIGFAQLGVYVVSGFLILKWIYLANLFARREGAAGMEYSPGWSVGWYFIPFANLWKPFDAFREIWNATLNPQCWKPLTTPIVLRWWWFFWLVSGGLGNTSLRLTLNAEEIDELITANVVTQLSDVASIPLCVIFLSMVKTLTQYQMNMSATVQPQPVEH